jgi:hypothetical protein
MKTIPTLLACLALGTASARADTPFVPDPVVIRDSIADPTDLSDTKPATLQFTQNDGAADSYLVDFAVNYFNSVDLIGPAKNDLILTAEWHKNTVAKNPSHSLLADLSLGGVAGDVSQGAAVNYLLTATYKDDRIKDDQSLGGDLTLCLVAPRGSPLQLLGSGFVYHAGEADKPTFKLEPLLQVGANYENLTSSSTPGDSGHVLRGAVHYLLKATFPKGAPNLVITVETRAWYDLDRSGTYSGGTHTRRLYQYGLTYYFDQAKVWGLAAKRRDGEDPVAGKPDQHFTSVAFTCNFGKRTED